MTKLSTMPTATDLHRARLGAAWAAAQEAGVPVVHDHSWAAMCAAFRAGAQAHADGWGPIPPDVWGVFDDEGLRANFTDGWHEARGDREQWGR